MPQRKSIGTSIRYDDTTTGSQRRLHRLEYRNCRYKLPLCRKHTIFGEEAFRAEGVKTITGVVENAKLYPVLMIRVPNHMSFSQYGLATEGAEQQVAFYLCEHFAMLPFISAIETLRIANRRANKPLYQWQVISADSEPVTASNRMSQPADYGVDTTPSFSMVFVVGPYEPRKFNHVPSLIWLRYQAKQGAMIGGIANGSNILAKAGLLDGYVCTTHWERIQEFKQENPRLTVTTDIFEIQGDRISCAGGSASMDMMLYLVEQQHGHELAASVAESMIYSHVRTPNEPQRMDLLKRTGVSHPALLEIIELMEANIEEPLTPVDLALLAQVSRRTLERLFQCYINTTPSKYYMKIRLEAAHNLLQNSTIKIVDAALACGFKSQGHFSSRYHSLYGKTPREGRKKTIKS